MSDQVDIKISQDLVKPIIEAKIQQAIAEGLNSSNQMIEAVASRILTTKVSVDGTKSRYSSDNKYTYMEYLSQDIITTAAKAALAEWVETRKKEIKECLYKQMSLKKNANILVQAVMNGLVESTKCKYRFSMNIKKD